MKFSKILILFFKYIFINIICMVVDVQYYCNIYYNTILINISLCHKTYLNKIRIIEK